MKCVECKYQNRCSLREFALDLIGCEGHSQLVPKTEKQLEQESEDMYWDDYASADGYY